MFFINYGCCFLSPLGGKVYSCGINNNYYLFFIFMSFFFFTYKQFCSQSPQGFWLACYHFTASTYSGYKIAV